MCGITQAQGSGRYHDDPALVIPKGDYISMLIGIWDSQGKQDIVHIVITPSPVNMILSTFKINQS